jgi:flagellar FliL protein
MSSAVAAEAPPAAPPKGKKKLIIIIAAVALVLVAGGGGAAFMMKKKADAAAAAEAEGEGGEHAPAHDKASHDPKAVPVFVPLDPFTVNLADRDAERYAQIGITLEIADAKTGDQIKAFMPAIRNNILMAIADRNAAELLGRDGKTRLARTVQRETSRALGAEIEPEEEAAASEDEHAADAGAKKGKKAKKKKPAELPVKAVHFSNFIVQ